MPVKQTEIKPCSICGNPTSYVGTGLCNNCWEIDSRLTRLKSEGLRYFLEKIQKILKKRDAL